MCIAPDPGAAARLRDIAASPGSTERSVYGIVTHLAGAGYVIKQKEAAATATRSKARRSPPLGRAGSQSSREVSPSPALEGQ
jgi:hypothetical protein